LQWQKRKRNSWFLRILEEKGVCSLKKRRGKGDAVCQAEGCLHDILRFSNVCKTTSEGGGNNLQLPLRSTKHSSLIGTGVRWEGDNIRVEQRVAGFDSKKLCLTDPLHARSSLFREKQKEWGTRCLVGNRGQIYNRGCLQI